MPTVNPKTYLIGYTQIDLTALENYLTDTDQRDFLKDIGIAQQNGLNDGEILCSFYAKMCYAALTTHHNKNITKVRSISDNLKSVFESAHGSVFEHFNLNFITTNCSRILTHELVRHRTGCAYSQTSGRYVRMDEINIVTDPILEPVSSIVTKTIEYLNKQYKKMETELRVNDQDFTTKKKLTSAMRRLMPNGQSNEIGWSCNIRALRHMIMMRTSRHAEREIRLVFNQVYEIVKNKFPLMLYGAKEEKIDGLLEITGMKTQPY